jgi:predicted nucleic acid-binding protein
MIDTNIILDVLLEREPFYQHSRKVLELCESGKIHGFISASTATDIFYLVRKSLSSTDEAYKALGNILNIVKILTVTNDDVNSAFVQRASDFEDCLLATCAKSNKCDGIVTRNKKDFLSFGITILSPEDVIDSFK